VSFCLHPEEPKTALILGAEFFEILHGKGASATAGRLRLRVVRNHKGGLDHFNDVVNGGTLKESHGCFIHDYPGAHVVVVAVAASVGFGLGHDYHNVFVVIEFVVDLELVLESGTTTGIDKDPQEVPVVVFAILLPLSPLFQQPFNLLQTTLGNYKVCVFVDNICRCWLGRGDIVHNVRREQGCRIGGFRLCDCHHGTSWTVSVCGSPESLPCESRAIPMRKLEMSVLNSIITLRRNLCSYCW